MVMVDNAAFGVVVNAGMPDRLVLNQQRMRWSAVETAAAKAELLNVNKQKPLLEVQKLKM